MKGVETKKLPLGEQLMQAIKDNDFEMAKELLIQEPTLIVYQDQEGNTPLHKAYLENGGKSDKFTRLLLEKHAHINITNNSGFTPNDISEGYRLMSFISNGNLNEVKSSLARNSNLINFRDLEGSTPLHQAAYSSEKEIVQFLLQNNANINAQNIHGDTPLHNAALSADSPQVKHDPKDTITLLIINNADVNLTNLQGDTPLHIIAQSENARSDIAEVLKGNGADIDVKNNNSQSPLDLAIKSSKEDLVEAIELGPQRHADLISKDKPKANYFSNLLSSFKYHIKSLTKTASTSQKTTSFIKKIWGKSKSTSTTQTFSQNKQPPKEEKVVIEPPMQTPLTSQTTQRKKVIEL